MAKQQFEDEAEELVLEEGGLHDHHDEYHDDEYHDDGGGGGSGEDHPVKGRRRRKRRRGKNHRNNSPRSPQKTPCYNTCIAWITLFLALGFGVLGIYWTVGGGGNLGTQQVPAAQQQQGGSSSSTAAASEEEELEGLPPSLPPPPEEATTTTTTTTTTSPSVIAPEEAETSSPNNPPENNKDDNKANHNNDDNMILGFDVGDGTGSKEQAEAALIKNQQINNFKKGSGILLNFLITHHGGTTVRNEFRKALKCPSFVCSNPTPADHVGPDYPTSHPWSHNDTSKNIDIVGRYFQFLMWQFGEPPKEKPYIADTDWENPNLVSMLVIREPISRALAGDGGMAPKYPNIITHDKTRSATLEQWWAFAHETRHNNNFALRVLSSTECCDGANTSQVYLDQAKELVKRFTFILDINCLQHSLDKVAEILGFEVAHVRQSMDEAHDHTPSKDRIPFPEVYEYLVEKNKMDIELYEYAKSLALLDCDAVYAAEAEAAEQQQKEGETAPP